MSFLSKTVSAIGGLLGGTGSALNKITGVDSQTEKTYKQQKEMMDAQNAFDLKMWNLQNQYNTPAAQFARMADAGIDINPTSYALGTGNLSNTAGLVTSHSGFSGSGSPAGNPVSMLMGVAQGIQDLKNAKADYKLKEISRDNIEAQIALAHETARQKGNDNAFFEKYGYYPPISEQPMGSGFETGVMSDIIPIILKYTGGNGQR